MARIGRPLQRFAWGILACACAAQGAASAQSAGGDYAITREAIAGGGVHGAGGDYAAVVTLAQAATGIQAGGDFTVRGGFHVPRIAVVEGIFADGFEP